MLGRGALNMPNLSRVVKYNAPRMPWPEVMTAAAEVRSSGKAGRYRFVSRRSHQTVAGLFA
jgi:tRNA-dihydrouridine synthase C